LSKEALPWLSVRGCFISISHTTVTSVSFSGELAYEIHVLNASLCRVYVVLCKSGKSHGMKLSGARAAKLMRMKKGFFTAGPRHPGSSELS